MPTRNAVPIQRRGTSRWRAATLACVYLLIAIHIAHWKIAGRTLAPLELNEVMYTLELGIVTAGFVFMLLAVVSVLFFGRFFCGWGCHILALEDLAAWLLARIGIRPKPIRSRLLLLVPPAALLYMFVWPAFSRWISGDPAPELRILGDAQGWASFVTTNFWRNLPGPWVTATTFLICGFAIVYVLGTRSFCRYACPYGAVFAFVDRLSPAGILATGDCTHCGHCTAACQSGIRVHDELATFGRVVSPSCLKDLDCVYACPDERLRYGFTRPALFRSWRRTGFTGSRYDFSIGEELLMASVFLTVLFVYRGLYQVVPFLTTLGAGGIAAYLAVLGWRLLRAQNLRFNNFPLKRAGALLPAGRVLAVALVALVALTAHSGVIRYHEATGYRAFDRAAAARVAGPEIDEALRHLQVCYRWGLYRPTHLGQRLATLHLLAGEDEQAAGYLTELGRRDPAAAHEITGRARAARGDLDGAIKSYRAATVADAARFVPRLALGELLAANQAFDEAARELAVAVTLEPDSVPARYNLGVMLTELGRLDEALVHYDLAASLDPRDVEVRNNLGLLHWRRGEPAAAEADLRLAIDLNPDFALPRFNLGRLLIESGRIAEGAQHLDAAAGLDSTLAPYVEEIVTATARPPSRPETTVDDR